MGKNIDRYRVLELLPKRRQAAHKGGFGTLCVVAGSAMYRGAAVLAAGGALRAGVGIVRVASTEKACAAVAAAHPGCVLFPLGETAAGGIDAAGIGDVLALRHTAVLAGCGLGNTMETRALVLRLLAEAGCPLVLDADALNTLGGHVSVEGNGASGSEEAAPAVEKARKEGLAALADAAGRVPCVITPHIGEMARLSGRSAERIAEAGEAVALEFAAKNQCTVVLKSDKTVVAAPDGRAFVHDRPNSGLAKGGSGDVLAGVIASLAAQGVPLPEAAAAGVWLHGEAGMLAAEKKGETGMNPADLPAFLCEVWLELGR